MCVARLPLCARPLPAKALLCLLHFTELPLPACCLQGVPTEREVLTTEQGLPVYRVMLRRTLAS